VLRISHFAMRLHHAARRLSDRARAHRVASATRATYATPRAVNAPPTRSAPSARSALRALLALLIALAAPWGAARAATGPFRVDVVDSKGVPVADAVVTLQPVKSAQSSANTAVRPRLQVPANPVVIAQVGREFVPRVTVLPVGSRVSFPNNDVVPHSVYSFSPTKQFEFEAYVGASPQVLALDKVGLITLGCNIHDWMAAYIVVVDTAHALATDARGVALLPAVADGDYELRVWHPQQRGNDAVLSITASEQTRSQAVTMDVAPPRVRYKPPIAPKRY
jgi:plastocyanin